MSIYLRPWYFCKNILMSVSHHFLRGCLLPLHFKGWCSPFSLWGKCETLEGSHSVGLKKADVYSKTVDLCCLVIDNSGKQKLD